MANPLALGDLVKMRVWCSVVAEAQAAVNTLWYTVAAVGVDPATDEDAAISLDLLTGVTYPPLLSTGAEYRGVQAQIYQTVEPFHAKFVEAFTNTSAGPGTGGAALMPLQVSGLISYQTARPGRANRGRTYVPFVSPVNATAAGFPTPGYIVASTALAADLSAGLLVTAGPRTATLVRGLFHGKDKAGVRPVPAFDVILGSIVATRFATQRKRGGFGRHNDSPI